MISIVYSLWQLNRAELIQQYSQSSPVIFARAFRKYPGTFYVPLQRDRRIFDRVRWAFYIRNGLLQIAVLFIWLKFC